MSKELSELLLFKPGAKFDHAYYKDKHIPMVKGRLGGLGLVRCEIDRRRYRSGIEVSDEQLARVRLVRDPFHGDWNYTIRPRTP